MAHASLGMLRFREGKLTKLAPVWNAPSRPARKTTSRITTTLSLSAGCVPKTRRRNYTPEQSAKIREHLKRAIALRPDFPESYSLLAFVSLDDRQ